MKLALKKNKLNKKGGFTLVEVIVVLVILAILAAFLVPSLTTYIDKANEKVAIAEARNLLNGLQVVASEKYAVNKTGIADVFDTEANLTAAKNLAQVSADVTISASSIDVTPEGTISSFACTIGGRTVTYDRDQAEKFTVS